MIRLQDISSSDIETFGPGTDLIVSLVAVLLITLAINTNVYKKRMLDLEKVREHQQQLISQIAEQYGVSPIPKKDEPDSFVIQTSLGSGDSILIKNEVTLQRISFGGSILFHSDDNTINKTGEKVLTTVSTVLTKRLHTVMEIQIQGHADLVPSRKYATNLDLAAQRAIAVFKFLLKAGIDPTKHIMSASSFGEYKPMQREYSDINFDYQKLEFYNRTAEDQKLNRRIEIVLIYRRYSERQ